MTLRPVVSALMVAVAASRSIDLGVAQVRLCRPRAAVLNFYEVQARAPAGTTKDQAPAMLRALLGERFGLKVHNELKQIAIYELLVRSGEPKLQKAVEVEPGSPTGSGGMGRITLRRLTMDRFATYLSDLAGRWQRVFR